MIKQLIALVWLSTSLYAFDAFKAGQDHAPLLLDAALKACKAIRKPKNGTIWQPSTCDWARLAYVKTKLSFTKSTLSQCTTPDQQRAFIRGVIATLDTIDIYKKVQDTGLEPLGVFTFSTLFPSFHDTLVQLLKEENTVHLSELFPLYLAKL